jgi:signal transduction histidine kinase
LLEKKVKERTADVEKLLKQKDEFISQLGHDLKTPLTPLNILLPIVKEREQDPQLKELIEVIFNNINYMKNLVIKTLALARLNSPNTQLSLQDIDLSIQIRDILNLEIPLFQGKNIIFENNIPVNTVVQIDLLQIRELFDNLISNAVKYSQENEVKITFDAEQMDDFIVVSVKDTGIGLESDQIQHIFDEFYKVDYARHDLQSTGLGLSICKRIVEKHGGRIWVESQGKGKGSTFFFTLKTPKGASGEENINAKTNEERINTVL